MEGKRRYPTDKRGVPFKPEGIGECYEVCFHPEGKHTNRHHLAFERAKYRTSIERQYRECGSMVVQACACLHADLHAQYAPPPKPERFTMIDVADGDITPTEVHIEIRRRDYV